MANLAVGSLADPVRILTTKTHAKSIRPNVCVVIQAGDEQYQQARAQQGVEELRPKDLGDES